MGWFGVYNATIQKYINEPHPGGGNPILAISGGNTEAIFTDLLGTSLGKVSENEYAVIDKTSFGANSSDKSSFFTGKPYIENLGYAFLLRNYRADMGKWLSQDLIGYPDGWNNLAYCCNRVIINYDHFGAVAGYIYPSAWEAAIAWGNENNTKSITNNKEYASFIYKNGEGYSYTDVVELSSTGGFLNPGSTENIEGYIHSHGAYNSNYNSDSFSQTDINSANNKGINAYLTTPSGLLLKYIQKLKKIIILSNKIPYDPNHPSPANPE